MKKFGIVLGTAAIVAIAGCKDPNYKRAGAPAGQNDVKNADTTVAQSAETAAPAKKQCTCAPGARHTKPCECGAENCGCIVEQKQATQPAKVDEGAKKPVTPEPETSVYVVQRGDYLAKISKKFNVTIASIKRLNNMNSDVIRVGQKLKIPGKVDTGSAAAAPAPAASKKTSSFTPYTGATKEYVVKSGDTLGAIAYGNGINIRQLKELNGLKSDALRVGQKIKIPAEKQAKAVAAKKTEKSTEKPAEKKAVSATAAAPKADEKPIQTEQAPADDSAKSAEAVAPVVDKPVEAAPVEAAPAPATATYVVQEGDDMTGVSIRWGVSAAEIRELNNLGDSDQLKPGQILKLPAEAQQ